jgi:hypothetical protein
MPDRVTAARCIPVDQRIDLLVNAVTNLIEAGGAGYDAGCGIDVTALAAGTIQAAVDGVSVICEDGVLKAVAASDLVAGCGITIAAGEVSAATDGTTIDCIGGNLSVIAYAFGKIVVATQTDVDADQVVDTLTLVAGANMAITTSGGTITFVSTDTNTTYTAGAGINLSGTKFIADPNTASHVGLVDPATGDDSSADDAQIGILWHAIEGFDDGRNQLHGHVADDGTKPKVTCKTTEDWLELLEDYSGGDSMVIGNDDGADGSEGDEKVKWIPSPQKVLWCIDPDGGHTITSTGTTLTLTLKVTKYTFDAVNFVSAVDADVTVNYTGTACS